VIGRGKPRGKTPKPSMPGVLIARQPIYDRHIEVTAYELLFRSLAADALAGEMANRATAQVIVETLMDQGTRVLTEDHPAYVNFTRDLIVGGYATVVPPARVIIEVLEDVEPDRDVLAALAELRQSLYRVALDDVVDIERVRAFRGVASIIKVDVQEVAPGDLAGLVAEIRKTVPRAKLVAEKVETWELFQHARALGFEWFQGYFLSKPVVTEHRTVPGFKPHYLRLLEATSRPDVDLDEIERIVRSDLALTNKLLRHANSASSMQARAFQSLRDALVLLGAEGVRRAAALLALAGLGGDHPPQLAIESVVRARFCESLATVGTLGGSRFDLFLLGMFSMVDAILAAPMETVVPELPVSPAVGAALMNGEGRLGAVLRLIEAHERGHWDEFREIAAALGIEEGKVAPLYVEAVGWARQVFADAARAA
jgi:c-di-GMP-related signal transduction protein